MPNADPVLARRRYVKFAAEYLKDFNGRRAAIAVGYAPKCAEQQASRLLRNGKVKAILAERMVKPLEDANLTVEKVLKVVAQQVYGNIQDLYDAEGNPKGIHELTRDQAALIESTEQVMKNATAGDGKIDRVLKIRTKKHSEYVKLAMKYLGLLVEKTEVTFAQGTFTQMVAEIQAGRERSRAATWLLKGEK